MCPFGSHGANSSSSSSSKKRRKQQNALMAKLKACAKRKDLDEASQIHAHILTQGLLEDDIYFSNALIHLYAKCGALARAIEVFEGARFRDSITWNALISGHAQHGFDRDAMSCFEGMRREGIVRDAVTYACILKACGSSCGGGERARMGKSIHAEIVRNDMLDDDNVFIGSALVDMYGKFGDLATARRVFDELRTRNLVCWNALLSGYARCGCTKDAFACFEQMKREGFSLDSVTFVCILKACGDSNAAERGREIHDDIRRLGLFERDAFLGTAVLDMYAKCGEFSKAVEVLEQLPSKDTVPWNSLIAGYVQRNRCEEAVECYDQMQGEGLSPDAVTFVCILKACSGMGAVGKGEEIHAESVRRGFLLGRNAAPIVGNALVDMYAKSGEVAKARDVFDELPVRDVVSWTALIAGYAQHGRAEEALDCFQNMQVEGPEPNAVTYVCALGACASVGAIGKGEEIHGEIVRAGLLVEDEEENAVLGNALVDMYAKCGALCKAQSVFDRLLTRDTVSWNAIITGYAQIGKDKIADLFERMVGEGVNPDRVTFTVMLNACSDLGMPDKGQMCFARMTSDYGFVPSSEHYACMVDLFGRAGNFGNALQVVEKMPMSDYLPVWTSLLGACQKWGNPELGLMAFEHAISLDAKHVATYVCMRNIYIGADMHDCADVIHAMRMENCSWGEPSWIDVS